jgi:hypothetical protein
MFIKKAALTDVQSGIHQFKPLCFLIGLRKTSTRQFCAKHPRHWSLKEARIEKGASILTITI